MTWLSTLLMRLAQWLSPQNSQTQVQNIVTKNQLDRLYALLSTLLKPEQNTVKDLSEVVQLERKIAEQKLEAETANAVNNQKKNLPHTFYGVGLMNDGVSWIAKAQLTDGTVLVGRGDCPAEALTDFDEQWLGIK